MQSILLAKQHYFKYSLCNELLIRFKASIRGPHWQSSPTSCCCLESWRSRGFTLQQVKDGVAVECQLHNLDVCLDGSWVDWSGLWDCSCQVRGRASSPRLMRRGRVNFPVCVGGSPLGLSGTQASAFLGHQCRPWLQWSSARFFLILNKFLLKCHILKALTRGWSIMSARFLKECRRNFSFLQQEGKRSHSEALSVHPNTQFLMSAFRRSY